ncbi:MAG TPA: hypothetical protein PKD79_00730 [Candidatus Doudnabacteria bacterium]|nr:hypothetical protein [Candidatus Doudnabacteria bacterium]
MVTITPQLLKDALNTKDQALAIALLASDRNQGGGLDNLARQQLSYVRFNSLSVSAAAELMKESLLAAYQIPGYVLSDWFKEYINQYEYLPEAMELCKQASQIISNNQELLGNQPLLLDGAKVPPTISSWLKHYALGVSTADSSNPLELMRYFNTNPDLRVLTEGQKTILKDLIKLNNFCQQVVVLWESLPEQVDLTQLPKSLQGLLDPLTSSWDEETTTNTETLTPTIAPVTTETQQENLANEFSFSPQNNFDLHVQPQRGLVFDQPTNVDLDVESANRAEQAKKHQEIQAKLEALKQRKQK